MERSVL